MLNHFINTMLSWQFPDALRPAFPRLKEKLEDADPGMCVCMCICMCLITIGDCSV